ncbi:PIN domain-containing protein [Roseinatronobacter monicus]|uniref:PIN domain-containing protein n=1 Tax=Roseinatronobacter monicus TaxID=393481 RepID=UPI003F37E711
MKQLFLDANILLDFYRFGKDDLDEIKKLLVLIQDDDLELFSNDQLQAEVARNREKVISVALSSFKSQNFSVQAPNFCKSSSELTALNDIAKEAGRQHEKLVKAILQKVKDNELQADLLIRDMFSVANNITISSETISKAQQRVDCGHPPGKKGSLGDAIHWESLLECFRVNSISIVSRDSDFISELDRTKPHSFLLSEWHSSKGKYCSLKVFPSLSAYFKEEFSQIKLSDEASKLMLIDQLEDSPNFSTTHDIVGELAKFDFFTVRQIIRLFGALVENNQVGWIGTDQDVNTFYRSLQNKAYHVPDEHWDRIIKLLDVEPDFFNPF